MMQIIEFGIACATRMNGGERMEHSRLGLFRFRDSERLGANARFSMLLRKP
jgi:hypothetical protein